MPDSLPSKKDFDWWNDASDANRMTAFFEQQNEIERLQREIKDGNAVFQGIVQSNATIGDRNMRLSIENDSLRAALEEAEALIQRIATGHGASDHVCTWQSLCRSYTPGRHTHETSANTAPAVSSEGAPSLDQTQASADLGSEREPSPALADLYRRTLNLVRNFHDCPPVIRALVNEALAMPAVETGEGHDSK